MKKIAIVLAALAVLLGLLLVAPSLVNWNRYRGEIGTRLEAVLHRQVTIAGPIGLHLLPSPALTVADVSVANIPGAAPGPMAQIGRLDLNLALFPLVRGQVEVTSLTVDHPVLNLQRLADGRANWQFSAPAAHGQAAKILSKPVTPATPVSPSQPASTGSTTVPAVAIRSLSLTNGQVTYRAAKGAPVKVSGIDAHLTMSAGPDGPVAAQLSTLVQGTPLKVTAKLGAQSEGKRALSATVESPALGVTVGLSDGTLSLAGAVPSVSGRLVASLPSPGRMMARLGKPAILPGMGPISLSATLNADAKAVSLSDLILAATPVRLTGRVRVALSGNRPFIDADLSGNAIDANALMGATQTGWLSPRTVPVPTGLRSPPISVAMASGEPLIRAAVTVPAASEHWSHSEINLSALHLVDCRATVKLQSLRWKKWLVTAPAAQLTLNDGTLDLTRFSGHVLGGSVIAALRLAGSAMPRLNGSLAVAGADLGRAGFGSKALALTNGLLNTSLRFSAAGRSVAALVGSLAGNGSFRVTKGVLTGFDLQAVSKRVMAVKKPADLLAFAAGGSLMGGTTDFSSLTGTLRATNGVIVTRDTKLIASGGTGAATARIDLPAWRMHARADVRLAALSRAPALGIVLDGPLNNPNKTVDAGAMAQYLAERGVDQLLKNKAGSQLNKILPGAGGVLQNLFQGLGGQ